MLTEKHSMLLKIWSIPVFMVHVPLRVGGVVQWLGRRISDQGSLVRTPVGAHFVVALSKSDLPCLVLVEPRKGLTDNRLGQTVTRLEITLCLMC